MNMILVSLAAVLVPSNVLLERDTCGRECLRQIAEYWGCGDAAVLDEVLPASSAPFSFQDLIAATLSLGLRVEPVTWRDQSLATFPCPAILHVRANRESATPDHFVNCFGVRDGKLVVGEGQGVLQLIDPRQIHEGWDGNALYISRDVIQWNDGFRIGWPVKATLLGIAGIVAVALLVYPGRSAKPQQGRSSIFSALTVSRRLCRAVVPAVSIVAGLSFGLWGFWRTAARTVPTTVQLQLSGHAAVDPVGSLSISGLVADPSIVVLHRAGVKGQKSLRGKVRIRNVGSARAEISEVRTSCSCLTFENIVGREIAPRSVCEFEIQVGIPSEGAVLQTLAVSAGEGISPANVTVRVPDGDAVPRVLKRSVRRAQFKQPGHRQSISFLTLEEEGSAPWITGLHCSLPEFRVDGQLRIDETKRRGYILRTYSADLTWSPLPGDECARERYGEAFASAVDGASQNDIPLTALIAYASHPCQPSVVILGAERRHEVVICGEPDDDVDWTILDEFDLPEWLAVKMRDIDGRHCLDVTLRTTHPGAGKQEFALQIHDKLGRIVKLPIIADPVQR